MKAFPDSHMCNNEGMELRDYFAAKAIPALMPRYKEMFDLNVFGDDWEGDVLPEIAHESYALADAMMQARGEKYGDWLKRRMEKYREENE
jgi:hypothetical protein